MEKEAELVRQKLKYLCNLNEVDSRNYLGLWAIEIGWGGISEVNKYAIQCYKLAGNGWDINLVSKIFKRMFKDTPPIISSGDLRNE